MAARKNSDKSKQPHKVLTDPEYIKIGKSFDRARERSMKDKRKTLIADFVEVK